MDVAPALPIDLSAGLERTIDLSHAHRIQSTLPTTREGRNVI